MNPVKHGIAILIAISFSSAAFSKPPKVYAYDLGKLNGSPCVPSAINDSGVLVGRCSDRGFITGPNGKGLSELGGLGTSVWPLAINAAGQVVGTYIATDLKNDRPFITDADGKNMRNIATEADHDANKNGYATDINDAGQVTGAVNWIQSEVYTYSFITGPNGVGFTKLGSLGGSTVYARSINATGQVAGAATVTPGSAPFHAFMTGPNGLGIIDLGAGDYSDAYDINDQGNVTGLCCNGSRYHAFVTGPQGVGINDLGTLNNNRDSFSSGRGINNDGVVVGFSSLSRNRKILRAMMTDKNNNLVNLDDSVVNLPLRVEFVQAVAVNASGQIAAISRDNHGYIICPVKNCAPK